VASLVTALQEQGPRDDAGRSLRELDINLLLIPNFFYVALRDFGLSLGALALARLSREFSS